MPERQAGALLHRHVPFQLESSPEMLRDLKILPCRWHSALRSSASRWIQDAAWNAGGLKACSNLVQACSNLCERCPELFHPALMTCHSSRMCGRQTLPVRRDLSSVRIQPNFTSWLFSLPTTSKLLNLLTGTQRLPISSSERALLVVGENPASFEGNP